MRRHFCYRNYTDMEKHIEIYFKTRFRLSVLHIPYYPFYILVTLGFVFVFLELLISMVEGFYSWFTYKEIQAESCTDINDFEKQTTK
jgi:hypothetical protein